MTTQQSNLHMGHLNNVLILARHGIAAIGAKLPAHEGKAAYESLGEVENFINTFVQAQGKVPPQAPQAPQQADESFEVHTIKIE